MIRPIFRCVRMYQNLQGIQSNYIILSKNPVIPIIGQIHEKHDSSLKQKRITEEIELVPLNLVDFLHKTLNCRMAQAAQLCIANPKLVEKNLSDIAECAKLLLSKGVSANVILDNPGMLLRDYKQLCMNLDILEDMKPKNINDFAPLVQVTTRKLIKLRKRARIEEDIVPKKHRIYYLSEAMNIEPCIVTKFISKRLFILESPFDVIDQNLQLLLKYIAPMDLLHDLWAFRYQPTVIELRLTQAQGHKKKLMPWMIRCPEERLLKTIKMGADEKAIVGDKTLVNYLSDRLKYDVETTEAVIQKHPGVSKVRVTRMKEILDFLLDEACFTAEDIAHTPRIFCHSLQTTKERLAELRSLGCRPNSLVVVCKSVNEYQKFIQNWVNVREQLKEKKIIKE